MHIPKVVIGIICVAIIAQGAYLVHLTQKVNRFKQEQEKPAPRAEVSAPQKQESTIAKDSGDGNPLVSEELLEQDRQHATMWEEIRAQEKKVAEHPENLQDCLKLASVYRKYEMAESARSCYQNAMKYHPENVDLLLEVALYFQEDCCEEALGYFRKVLELRAEHPRKSEITQSISGLEARIGRWKVLGQKGAGEQEILAALQAQLDDPSPVQQSKAIERLATVKKGQAVQMLGKFVEQQAKKVNHRRAVVALRKMDMPESAKWLEQKLYAPQGEAYLKVNILLAMREWGNEKDLGILEQWLASPAAKALQAQGEWAREELKKRLGK